MTLRYPEFARHTQEVTDADLDGIRDAMNSVQAEWTHDAPVIDATAGTESAFDGMAKAFRGRVQSHLSLTDRFKQSETVEAGFGILGRYFYAGALTGALNGYSVSEVDDMMFKPTSYKSIEVLTHEINSSAKEIEFENGLRPTTHSGVDSHVCRFVIDSDGGLKMLYYPIDRLNARRRLAEEGRIDDEDICTPAEELPTNCGLNRRGAFALCSLFPFSVSLNDPRLVQATLDLHQK